MKKIRILIFILSLLGNMILTYTLNLKTVYLDEEISWISEAFKAQGVVILNNEKEQSDTKKLVQHYKFECDKNLCSAVSSSLVDNTNLYQNSFKPEIIKISYDEKFAILKYGNCVFTISDQKTTFVCSEKNESGSLGNHIELHLKQHSLF